jgi:hypothetical protein
MSAKSDKYERDVAKHINGSLKGMKAERPKVSVSFPDVLVTCPSLSPKPVWVEVKMDHNAFLMKPRYSNVFRDSGKSGWEVSYDKTAAAQLIREGKEPVTNETPATDILIRLLNNSKEATLWVDTLRSFLKDTMPTKWNNASLKYYFSIFSTSTNRKANENRTVEVNEMKAFLEAIKNPKTKYHKALGGRGNQTIATLKFDVGKLVTIHYANKSAPADYMVSGGEFYRIGEKNPLKLKGIPAIDDVSRPESFTIRIGSRTDNFEIQPDIKLSFWPASKYSIIPKRGYKNPFTQQEYK